MKRVALLSALPRSFEEILSGSSDRSKDYIRTQVLINANTPESAWAILEPYLVGGAKALFDWCRLSDIYVLEKAGLSELEHSLNEYEIVVAIAHWKGPNVNYKNLPDTLENLKELAQVFELEDQIPNEVSPRIAKRALQFALNEKVASWSNWLDVSGLGHGSIVVGDYFGRCLAREWINSEVSERLSLDFVPGARLELSDGLWSAKDVASCFPKDWEGVCDFVCCRSLYLADVVKARTQRGLVRADARELEPKDVFEVVAGTLEAVASGKSYHVAAYEMDGGLI